MKVKRWAIALGLASSFVTGATQADPYKPSISVQNRKLGSITFSRLVVRLAQNEIGVDAGHLRIQFIETLRRLSYPARGTESVVFDRDDSNQARFVLGGTANEMQCVALSPHQRRCWLGVAWEVLDRERGRVVYRAQTRHASEGNDPTRLADELIWGTFYSLLSRQTFVTALSAGRSHVAGSKPSFTQAKYLRCPRGEVPMPGSAEALMQATVLVQAGERIGSGTMISADGFVLTAAHVVDGETSVHFQARGRPKIEANVIRVDSRSDVALLKATTGLEFPCIAVRGDLVTAGEDLFAIGSPVAQELAFTLTRGVVSGVRRIDDVVLVQTDASINRGNSGGPLLDSKGRLVGVVSWKIMESGVEGIAFGVSTHSALAGLALEPGNQSDSVLSRAVVVTATARDTVDDVADPVPGLVAPLASPPPAASPPPPEPKRPRGPKSKNAKLFGTVGLITAGVGVVGVGVTYALYEDGKDTLRQDGFDRLQLANDISWVTLVGGAAAFGISELLPRDEVPTEKSRPRKEARPRPSLSVGIGLGVAVLRGTY